MPVYKFGFVGMMEMEQKLMCYLAEQIRGVSYKPDDLHKQLDENSVILLRANNIDDGQINFDDVVYVDRSKVSCSQFLRKGDILVCASSGSRNLVGKAAQIDFEGKYTFGAFCKVVRPKEIDAEYLGMYFLSPTYRSIIASLAQGANINNIKNEHIDSLIVNIGNENECQQIVNILSRLLRVIHLRQQEIKELDDLIKARFVEMFGSIHESTEYPYAAVKDLTDVISGGTPSRDKIEYWDGGTIPWVKTTELQNNVIIDVDEYITEAGLFGSSAKLVPAGTVLVAMYGQGKTRGMTAYLDIEASTNQACACILPSDKIDSMFLWKYFELSYDKLRSLAQGAGQPNLNGNMIKNFKVLVPPIEMQKEYVDFVKQVDKSKFVYY